MSENRRHRRVSTRQRIWCEGDDITLYVQALNVSEEGIFVRTVSPPKVGSQFRVTFTDPDLGDIVARVVVVWTRTGNGEGQGQQPGMGLRIIRFEQGADEFRELLDREMAREAKSG